ncbi:two pore domain potassium channel family protein [Candidatus Pacearchaeota archaeon]|nr:two pore domain potassium channel family protein [Candidatus Pacearchaeota archaeon]
MKKSFKKVEFFLAIFIAVFLIGSLLSQKYLNISRNVPFFLILAFVVVKIVNIVKSKGTIFEDYASLSIIILFGLLHFITEEKTNTLIIISIVLVILYSVGLMPWINTIVKSKKIASFILSYAFLIVMIILLFAGIYFENNDDFIYNGGKTELSFEDSLYFSAISFTTVGYGEIAPTGINKLIASVQAITGMVLNIAFIGHIFASKRFR